MPDDEFLSRIEKQLHVIATNCFDLAAKESLRVLRGDIARRLAGPPIALPKDTDGNP